MTRELGRVDTELGHRLRPVLLEHSRPDIVTTANSRPVIVAASGVILPRHHKAAAHQADHRGVILTARELNRVDTKLIPNFRTRRIVALTVDVRVLPTIMTAATVILPGHHKAATFQARHRWRLLSSRFIGINQELPTRRSSIGTIALSKNIVTGSATMITALIITPGHHKASILERTNRWIILMARHVGVYTELPGRSLLVCPQVNLIIPTTVGRRHHHRHRGRLVDRTDQPRTNLRKRVTQLDPVTRRRPVHRHRVHVTRLDRSRQRDHVHLARLAPLTNHHDIVAASQFNPLHILNTDAVRTRSQRQLVFASSKSGHQPILRRRET